MSPPHVGPSGLQHRHRSDKVCELTVFQFEWAMTEPKATEWLQLLRDHEKIPPDLPPSPFFVFGPAETVREISNIGAGALEGE